MLRRYRQRFLKARPSRLFTKSPLKAKPLRNPGQSLDEIIQRLIDEDGSTWAVVVVYSLVTISYEWYRWYAKVPYQPVFITLFLGSVAAYSTFKIWQIRLRLQRLRLARDGEKAVGQYLELLRTKGYQVFHDVVGNDFNLDHVLIGPQGVFTIETKTFSKPSKGRASIVFDGESITVKGRMHTEAPIIQAKAQANWLGEQITASTGQSHSVKPVVVFPGWFVNTLPKAKGSPVWVLNPKALPKFLENAPNRLNAETIQLISYHLSRYIRTQP